MTTQEELKQIKQTIERLKTYIWLISVLLLSIIFWTACYCHKEFNKVIPIDLPEELPYTISKDSLNPDTVLIYKVDNKYIIKYN